ncbi:MAG: MATE family efflux transporter [Edaphocola sp.]
MATTIYDTTTEARKTAMLAAPVILGELAQMALHLMDTAMVGALGYKELAAASLVLSVMNIPFVAGIGITIAVSQMVSMWHGRRDSPKVSHYLFNGFFLCAFSAIVIALLLEWGMGILHHLGQDEFVVGLAVPFMRLMGWSVIPMILFMALKQFADGLEYTRTAMALSLAALPVNALLNWLLIFGNFNCPALGLAGAGWATLTTRCLMFIIMLAVIMSHKTFRRYVYLGSRHWRLKWHTLKELLRIGVPSSLQISMEAGAFAVSGIIIGTISPMAQAAHQIALSCAAFTFMVSMGLAQAGSIRTSNAFGRGDWRHIKVIGKSAYLLALGYGVFCALFFGLFRYRLPELFNSNPEVVSMSGGLLLFAAVFQISDATQAVGSALLRGVKDVKVPTLFVAIAYWGICLPLGYFLAKKMDMGAGGMWLGFIVGLTCASVLFVVRFSKNNNPASREITFGKKVLDFVQTTPTPVDEVKASSKLGDKEIVEVKFIYDKLLLISKDDWERIIDVASQTKVFDKLELANVKTVQTALAKKEKTKEQALIRAYESLGKLKKFGIKI